MPTCFAHPLLRWLPCSLARWISRRGRSPTPHERELAQRWNDIRGMTADEAYRAFVLREPVEEVLADPRGQPTGQD